MEEVETTTTPTAAAASTTTNPNATTSGTSSTIYKNRSVQFSITDVDTDDAAIKTPQAEASSTAAFNTLCPPPDPPPVSLFSKATVHESEAETRLLQALDQERAKFQQKQQQNIKKNQKGRNTRTSFVVFPDNLPSTPLPTIDTEMIEEDVPEDEGVQQLQKQQPVVDTSVRASGMSTMAAGNSSSSSLGATHPSGLERMTTTTTKTTSTITKSTRVSSLTSATIYLEALHKEGEDERQQKQKQPNHHRQALSDPLGNLEQRDDAKVGVVTGETPATDRIVQMAPILQAAATVFQSKFHPQEEQTKEEKDIAPSIGWDPSTNSPNLKNDSGTQHQQQEEDIDITPSHLPPSQSFVAAAQYENKDLDPSESSSSWVPQGSHEQDAIGSSGGDDDDNNNKKKNNHPDPENNKNPPPHPLLGRPAQSLSHGMKQAIDSTVQEWSSLHDFLRPKKSRIRQELGLLCGTLMAPCLVVSIILFHAVGNPPTGRCYDKEPCGFDSQGNPVASASWLVLFFGVRFPLTWLLARATDVLVIDWLLLQHAFIVKLLGSHISLIWVQAKGWPSVLFWWAIWFSILLYGDGSFPKHWLFWQDFFKLFSEENPSGTITTNAWLEDAIIVAFFVAIAVALKRYFVGLHLGRRLCIRFNERVQEALKLVTFVSELSLWARRKHKKIPYGQFLKRSSTSGGGSAGGNRSTGEESGSGVPGNTNETTATTNAAGTASTSLKSSNPSPTDKINYEEILEPWTEPSGPGHDDVSAHQIIEFRQAFTVVTKPYFFSSAFGPVESRHQCIRNADRLFRRLVILMGDHDKSNHNFEINDIEDESIDLQKLTHWMYKGFRHEDDRERAKDLIDLLSPDSEGCIQLLGFVQAIDAVYKKVRLLENAVKNASQIDRGYEHVINIFFYMIVGIVVLALLSVDALTLVLSISGLILAFGFMIGSGSAQVFQGIVMVLGRQPYDIGDRIAIANVDEPPDMNGSSHWMVEKVDLVTTTARLTGTSEVASFSNGSISDCRIINMNRSPDPLVYVYVRFATDIPYSTILIFKAAVEAFVQERPQEWQAMLGFRTSRIAAEENFVEYMIVLQHRQTWQSIIPILESKAAVSSFCVELQQQLGCHYSAPSMPVVASVKRTKPAFDPKSIQTRRDDASKSENSVNGLIALASQFSKSGQY